MSNWELLNQANNIAVDTTDDARAARTAGEAVTRIGYGEGQIDPALARASAAAGGGTIRGEYFNQPSINSSARDNTGEPLITSAAINGLNTSCDGQRYGAYGQIRITETPGGHQIILNDTLGSESIMIRHSSGSGIEMRPDGSILISGTQIQYNVRGSANFVVEGNTMFRSDGDMTFDAGGGIQLRAGGAIETETTGDIRSTAGGNIATSARGNSSHTVMGAETSTVLGLSSQNYLGGVSSNTRGNHTQRVAGTLGIYGNGSVGISAQGQAWMSSPDVNIQASDISVTGATGNIGGEGVIGHYQNVFAQDTLYGSVGRFNSGAWAPQFNGDLKGIAEKADAAAVFVDQNPDAWSETGRGNVTSDGVAAALGGQENGVRQVLVDPGNYIRQELDRSIANGAGAYRDEHIRVPDPTGGASGVVIDAGSQVGDTSTAATGNNERITYEVEYLADGRARRIVTSDGRTFTLPGDGGSRSGRFVPFTDENVGPQ